MIDKSNSYDDKDKDTDIYDNFYTYKIPDTQRTMTILMMAISILAAPTKTKIPVIMMAMFIMCS